MSDFGTGPREPPCVPREDTGDAVNQETGCPRRRVCLAVVLGLQPEEPWGRNVRD